MERSEIERKLGRQMHEISKVQELIANHQKILQALQDGANELDQQLKDLD